MGRERSRTREKRSRTRDKSRDRKRRRSCGSYDRSSGRSYRNSSRSRRNSRDGLRNRDRHDSRSPERHRSRTRDRRDSRSRDRSRSDIGNRKRTRTPSPPVQTSSTHKNSEVLPKAKEPMIPNTSERLRSIESSVPGSEASTLAHALMQAIKTMQPARSQNYYVSNFDPSINSIEAWCDEVDRAREANGWGDHECLSRVATCHKGDAKVWLGEWVTNDRTWSNFVREFKPLCPSKLDYANILFEAMNTTSDKYSTYSEYARRTLLRLRIVQGLSDDLRTLIVIRGIDNPQVRAAAANANLTPDTIVSFLSIYAKPSRYDRVVDPKRQSQMKPNHRSGPKCFNCNQTGHISRNCKKPKSNAANNKPANVASDTSSSNTQPSSSNSCTFCKRSGHTEDKCFTKAKAEQRNPRNVNLCSYRSTIAQNNDMTTAIIDGIPVDVLIDSGALDVSLISSDILKHFTCQPKPRRCVLKGLSETEVVATSYVTFTVEFSDVAIEVDLVVVPSSFMNAPIIIGTDVLNREGITYIRTKDDQYLTRSDNISANVNAICVGDQVKVNTPLQGTELDGLMSVINEFSDYLISGTAMTTVKTGEMEIKLTSSTPVVYRPYRLSYSEKLKVRTITQDLLDKRVIRRSKSEYASPIILVRKRDGSDRLCVDFRALNRITVKDRYPLPLIDDHIDRLGACKFFCSLDMATGFHQIPLKEECIHFTVL